jgi:hypothetical protein
MSIPEKTPQLKCRENDFLSKNRLRTTTLRVKQQATVPVVLVVFAPIGTN